jgi:hypothetical protein
MLLLGLCRKCKTHFVHLFCRSCWRNGGRPFTRVARWHIFKPKIPIWVNFGGSYNGRCLYIICPFGLFYGYLVYFVALWYILWLFGIYFPVMVCCTTKNLATLPFARFNRFHSWTPTKIPFFLPYLLSLEVQKRPWELLRPSIEGATLFCRHPNYQPSKCRHSKCRHYNVDVTY